jgi:hypothetical protein
MKKTTIVRDQAYRDPATSPDLTHALSLVHTLEHYAFHPKPGLKRGQEYVRYESQANVNLRFVFTLAHRVEAFVRPHPSEGGARNHRAMVQIDFYLESDQDPFFGITACVEHATGEFEVYSTRVLRLYELRDKAAANA